MMKIDLKYAVKKLAEGLFDHSGSSNNVSELPS